MLCYVNLGQCHWDFTVLLDFNDSQGSGWERKIDFRHFSFLCECVSGEKTFLLFPLILFKVGESNFQNFYLQQIDLQIPRPSISENFECTLQPTIKQ